MRLISRSAFLALMAVCALSAVAVTSASAAEQAPEFKAELGQKLKFPVAFTGTSGEIEFHMPGTGATYTCKNSTIAGDITGPKELGKVTLHFQEGTCATWYGLGFCWSNPTGKGPNTGWTTRELKGKLGYISKTGKTVGLVIEPISGPLAICGDPEFTEGEILGSLFTTVSPTRSLATTFRFEVSRSGGKLEGEATTSKLERKWEGGKPQTAELYDSLTVTMPQKIEITA